MAYQVSKMVGKPYLFYKIMVSIRKRIATPVAVMDAKFAGTPEPVPYKDRLTLDYQPIEKGGKWGGMFGCAWFNFKGQVPLSAKGKRIAAIIDVDGEGCIYNNEGDPVKGLARVMSVSDSLNVVSGKKIYFLPDNVAGGDLVDLWVDAGNNGNIACRDRGDAKFYKAEIAVVNESMYGLFFDMLTLLSLVVAYPSDSERYGSIMSVLNKAVKVVGNYSDDNIKRARVILSSELNKKTDREDDVVFYASGHSHLDLAWLWPIRETQRKGARTFANQLDLLERYPDYIYSASQPQLYKWMKEQHPGLYKRIKNMIEGGRLEPVGGMWVEPDCNVPSGESMVRQFLYGKRFFRQEFNKDMKVHFVPDAFGFNGALPQIMKKSGVEYFLTIKLSWNEYNAFPYHSFIWKGIDGTEVMAHMPPSGNYNMDLTGYYMLKSAEHYKQKSTKAASVLFGAGDGGGGPCEVQLEMLQRERSLEGMNVMKPSKVIDFFNELEKSRKNLPVWQGELYLEKHTGTFTSQSNNKYYNRKLEIALHDAEFLASVAHFTMGEPYPHDKFNKIWEEVLLYQFHDILPGSSINRVYEESVARYKVMLDEIKEIITSLLSKLKGKNGIGAYNTTSFEREEWLNTPEGWKKAKAAPYSSAVIKSEQWAEVGYDNDKIYSDKLNVQFNDNGEIISLKDKTEGREYARGLMNELSIYKDKKLFYNAWDISPEYINSKRGKFKLTGYNTFIDGPKVIRRNFLVYGKSSIVQDIILTAGKPYVEFNMEIDWQETLKMLRADFYPIDFGSEVMSDMQFGNIKRGTTTNDRKGYAQYEICAHKWVDVEKEGYGIALLNDCKYGHRVKDGLMSLNLLRSTVYPDKTADKGKHVFKYALYPHKGAALDSELIKLGYLFNYPLELAEKALEIKSLVSVDNQSIVIDTIKKSEDGEGLIVRMYESKGQTQKATIKTSLEGYKEYDVNLIEDIGSETTIENMTFAPYEIKSIVFKK